MCLFSKKDVQKGVFCFNHKDSIRRYFLINIIEVIQHSVNHPSKHRKVTKCCSLITTETGKASR